MFVYKHQKTIEYVKKQPIFKENYKLCGWITRKFIQLMFRVLFLHEFEYMGDFLICFSVTLIII